jgi:hypothetical protein
LSIPRFYRGNIKIHCASKLDLQIELESDI